MYQRLLAFLLIVAALFLFINMPQSVTAQATFGTNWSATFYNTPDFTGSGYPATYPNGLNFNWAGIPTLSDNITPVPGVTVADNFSVRFITVENFATTADYRFFGTVDDAVTIFIDGIPVFTTTVPGPIDFVRNLVAGSHTIQVEFVDRTSLAIIQLQWQPGATPLPTATVELGPIGNVVIVSGLSFRTGPYLGASRIGVLTPGNAYPVVAKNNDESILYTWYKVRAGEQEGWVSGRYFVVDRPDEVPEQTSVFQEIDTAPDLNVTAVPRAYMNFRIRPSIRSSSMGQIPWGDETSLIGRTIQDGRNHWFQVRYNNSVGWIYAPYVSVRGDINRVPIR